MMTWTAYDNTMLTLAIWREARGGGYDAMFAVGCSIRNRVLRPSWWGGSYAAVITKKWQYSSLTAPGDPQLTRFPSKPDDEDFDVALLVANDVISGVKSTVPGADSYYDDSIPAPKWATAQTFVKKIGRLNFHNIDKDFEA